MGLRRRCRRPTEVGRENILPYPYPYLYLIATVVVVVAQCYYDYGEDGEDRYILVDYIKC